MDFIKIHKEWIPVIIIILILGPSLPFKFSGHPQPTHIFNVVGDFLGLEFFKSYGAIIIGVAELMAIALLLMPKTRVIGALVTMGTMAGAIIFHLFSPLGIDVHFVVDGKEMVDGSLFYHAILALLCGAYIAYGRRAEIPVVGGMLA